MKTNAKRGINNSSEYRVRPLMEHIKNNKNALTALLGLLENKVELQSAPDTFNYDGENENCKEMPLKPTKRHLLELIDQMSKRDHKGIRVKGKDREELFYGYSGERDQGDMQARHQLAKIAETRERARQKARAALEKNYDALSPTSRKWYIFEGYTYPDIFIESEDYVIVAEGKWTEKSLTTTTTYLNKKGERSQMVRHIQGALNYAQPKNKKVYAFYIVEANCGYEITTSNFKMQLENEAVKPESGEKQKIIDAYLGYTTWSEIEDKLNITFRKKL